MANKKIAFVGLGIMGKPMALNLLRAGYPTFVYARRAEACRALVKAGAHACGTPAAAARRAEVCITMVGNTKDVESVVFGNNGLALGMQAGSVLIDMSTIHPRASVRFAQKIDRLGSAMLDAPVSGGEQGAVHGALSIMVGGEKETFDAALGILRCMGKNVTRIGMHGAGQLAKACNQLLAAQTIAAVAEAFELAHAAGVDAGAVRSALLGGFAGSRILEVHGQRMLEKNYRPGFKAELHLKDMDIVMDTARSLGIRLHGCERVHRCLQELNGTGGGQLDSAAIAEIVHRRLRDP